MQVTYHLDLDDVSKGKKISGNQILHVSEKLQSDLIFYIEKFQDLIKKTCTYCVKIQKRNYWTPCFAQDFENGSINKVLTFLMIDAIQVRNFDFDPSFYLASYKWSLSK